MSVIDNILANTAHRPYKMLRGEWVYYMKWNHVLFLHWKVDIDVLRPLVPMQLDLDMFNDDVYVSLVAFTMQKTRPRYLPSLKFISDFEEINIRTYVKKNGKQGVYFLSIEAQKYLSVLITRALSGLPYQKSNIEAGSNFIQSSNHTNGYYLNANFEVKEPVTQKTTLDKWLTERYCFYLEEDARIFDYDVHHEEWQIKQVHINSLRLNYQLGNISLLNPPLLMHYSNGVKVLAWRRAAV